MLQTAHAPPPSPPPLCPRSHHQATLSSMPQPLLLAERRIGRGRVNLLEPLVERNRSRRSARAGVLCYLVPQLMSVHPLSCTQWRTLQQTGCLLFRVESLLVARDAHAQLVVPAWWVAVLPYLTFLYIALHLHLHSIYIAFLYIYLHSTPCLHLHLHSIPLHS